MRTISKVYGCPYCGKRIQKDSALLDLCSGVTVAGAGGKMKESIPCIRCHRDINLQALVRGTYDIHDFTPVLFVVWLGVVALLMLKFGFKFWPSLALGLLAAMTLGAVSEVVQRQLIKHRG